jgi:hypothetical protein
VVGEIGDERRLHSPVEAFADGDHAERDRQERRRGEAVQLGSGDGNDQQGGGPNDPERGERPHPPMSLEDSRHRQLREHDHDRVEEEEDADPTFRDPRLVLRVDRQCLQLRHPCRDEDEVEADHGHEDAVSQHLAVAARPCRLPSDLRRLGHAEQHDRVEEERGGVAEEKDRERVRIARRRYQAPGEPAEADAEVHHHALHGEGLVALLLRRQPRDQRRLARPEPAVPGAGDRARDEALPGVLDENVAPEADRHQPERDCEGQPPSDAINERPSERTRDQSDGSVRADDQTGRREVDVADVVEVDEDERVGEAVPEGVDERPPGAYAPRSGGRG